MITARAGGLLGMVAAYLLALPARPGARWAKLAAGLIAAAGIVIARTGGTRCSGDVEPMLIATALWAVLAHLDGRRGWAFSLGVATSLIRPEAWPRLSCTPAGCGSGAAAAGARRPRPVSIPLFWFVPPWVGSGQPFLAAVHAQEYNGDLGKHPLFTVLGRGVDIQLLPVLLAAIVAVAFAWFDKPRDRLLLALAGGTVAWWVIVVGMTLDGYPGLERFICRLPA